MPSLAAATAYAVSHLGTAYLRIAGFLLSPSSEQPLGTKPFAKQGNLLDHGSGEPT
jgi:hypothetical protein